MSGNTTWDRTPMYGPSGPPPYPVTYSSDEDTTNDITDQSTIITIYPMVMDEKPDDIDLAATGWSDFAKQLDKTKRELHTNYNPVGTEWDSDAGVAFSAYVVKTIYSFENWYNTATNISGALSTLAGKIRGLQQKMETMWDDGHGNGFAPEMKAAEDKQKHGHALWDGWSAWTDGWSLGWNGYDTDLDPVMEKYTKRVKAEIVEPMNQAFEDAYSWMGAGMKFDGPSNGPSFADIQDALKRLNTPSVNPGAVPHMPGAGKPPMPNTPTMPTMPTVPSDPPLVPTAVSPPPLPTIPTTAPTMPTVPTAPSTPTVPPAPQSLTRPDLPPTPDAPTAPNGPTAPNAVPPVLPNALRAPESIPSTPNAPKAPSTSGLGRGAPPSGFDDSEGPGGPGRPTAPGMPHSLRGRGGGMPEGPEMPPGMRSGMRPPPPMLRGRGGKPDKKSTHPGGPSHDEPELPGRGTPALSGRNGRRNERRPGSGSPGGPGSGGDDVPPNRLGSPRNLQGIRDRRPRWRPGSLEAEKIPLRQLPTMTGRLGPDLAAEESLETAQRALRPGLGGRGLTPPTERRGQSVEREETRAKAPTVDFVGDAELFTPAKAAPPVIGRPSEQTAPVGSENPSLAPKATGA